MGIQAKRWLGGLLSVFVIPPTALDFVIFCYSCLVTVSHPCRSVAYFVYAWRPCSCPADAASYVEFWLHQAIPRSERSLSSALAWGLTTSLYLACTSSRNRAILILRDESTSPSDALIDSPRETAKTHKQHGSGFGWGRFCFLYPIAGESVTMRPNGAYFETKNWGM